jgi:hypothetical protein
MARSSPSSTPEEAGADVPASSTNLSYEVEMIAQCGTCGQDHLYRLISDDPEDWEQLQDCGD